MNAFTKATDALSSVLPFRSAKPSTAPAGQASGPRGGDARISPLAVIDPRAIVGEGCEIGPFCVIGPDVILGTGNRLLSHVVITGRTTVGKDNVFHPHAVIGGWPQDKKYNNEPTGLQIGDRNQVREAVTLHTGTLYGAKINGGGITRVGDDNLLMVNFHAGHDVQIGSRCILANNVMLAGHVVIGNNVVLNGGVGVGAFITIDDFAYVSGYARISHDVPPFVKVQGEDGAIRGFNAVGLKRAGYADADIEAIEEAYRKLFGRRQPLSVAMAELAQVPNLNPHAQTLLNALKRRNSGKHGRYLEGLRK